MNSNDTETDAGKLTVDSIITVVDLMILYTIAIVETLFVILILYNIKRKNATFTTIYYYILMIGFFINALNIFMYKLTYTIETPDVYRQSIYNIIQWYNSRFIFFWNVILAFNRFTAVFFYIKHKKIWSGKSLIFIMSLLMLYPFISSSYTLGEIGCFFKNPYDCLSFFLPEFDGYITASCNIVAFALGLATAFTRKLKGQKWAKKQKFETYLLVQSFISSTLFLLYQVIDRIVSEYLKNNVETFRENLQQYITSQILLAVVNYFAQLAHLLSAILILCLS